MSSVLFFDSQCSYSVGIHRGDRPTQPGRPFLGRYSEYRPWFGHRWGRNGESCVVVGPATRSAGILN